MLKPPGDHDYELMLYQSLYRTMQKTRLIEDEDARLACVDAVQDYLDEQTADLRLWFWEYEAACEEIIEQFAAKGTT